MIFPSLDVYYENSDGEMLWLLSQSRAAVNTRGTKNVKGEIGTATNVVCSPITLPTLRTLYQFMLFFIFILRGFMCVCVLASIMVSMYIPVKLIKKNYFAMFGIFQKIYCNHPQFTDFYMRK